MKIKSSALHVALGFSLTTAVVVGGLTTVATVLTGCAGDRYSRSTGEYVDDKSINARVHSALNDNPEYKFDSVRVDTFKGRVQLSGFVDTSAQKSSANNIASKVEGVRGVENGITVKQDSNRTPGEYVDDKVLADRVDDALAHGEYKYDDLSVVAYKGTVQLSGFVNTADQKTKAGSIARDVTGVKSVVNNITVKNKSN